MRSTYFILFFVLLAFATASCKKTTTGEQTPPEPTPTDKLTAKEWLGDSIRIQANASTQLPQGIDQKVPLATARMTFNKDKTFSAKLQENTAPQTGNWDLLENNTKIKLTGGFQTSVNDLINSLLPNLASLLPAGVTIQSVILPEIYELKTLTDTKLVMKGAVTINVKVSIITLPVPVNMEISFKR